MTGTIHLKRLAGNDYAHETQYGAVFIENLADGYVTTEPLWILEFPDGTMATERTLRAARNRIAEWKTSVGDQS